MTETTYLSAQEVAEKVSEAMYADDLASQHLGITLDEIGPGSATMSMDVTDVMLNGHKTCHGGYIFTLADTAFAFACNACNQNTVAGAAQINYLKAVPNGTRMIAKAVEINRTKRTGLYDISVTDQDGNLVASFRGNSHTIKGQRIPGLETKEEEK